MDATVFELRDNYTARRRNAGEVSWAHALPMWRLRATLMFGVYMSARNIVCAK